MSFQFHKVRLKDTQAGFTQGICEFQFHKVRLKVFADEDAPAGKVVSIP